MAAQALNKRSARRFGAPSEQSSPLDKQTPTCPPRASSKPLKSDAEYDPSPAESRRKTRCADEAARHTRNVLPRRDCCKLRDLQSGDARTPARNGIWPARRACEPG